MRLAARRIEHVSKSIISLQAELPERKVLGETMSQTGNDADNRKVVIVYESAVKTYVLSNPVQLEPAPAPKPKEGRVEPVLEKEVAAAAVGDVLELRGLNFYGNSGKPLPESEPRLAELLKIMKARPTLTIQIQGHICCREDDYEGIARMRAQTVYHYLIDHGIAKDRVSYKSFGGTRPLYPMPEENEEQRVANRRVEIQIISF
jgi:outer membrane protein OmpA-like peptidoglycan-associated protein